MNLSIGIVGLPNVGKSTLFQALTKKEVNISNYPFATIAPNVGIVEVPDERLLKLKEIMGSVKAVPAAVEFVDIAGLVKNAHKGEGLGNQFLSRIREVDLILEVVRAFEQENVIHAEENVNPLRDIETIKTELALKDMETLKKAITNAEKDAKTGEKKTTDRLNIFKNIHSDISERDFSKEEKMAAKELGLLSVKPVLYVINSGVRSADISKFPEPNITLDVKEELDLNEMSEKEKTELGAAPKLPSLIKKAYELLKLITFFTANKNEARAWSVKKGANARQSGGAVHSDFEEKFIRASVINFKELLKIGNWKKAQELGKIRTEGKDYVVQEGDVIEFKI